MHVVLMDMEFEKIKDEFMLVYINTTAAREHVGEIECRIHIIKERCRAIIGTLPYSYYHKQVIIHLMYFVIMFLHVIPDPKNGVSGQFSPREIVTGRKLSAKLHCRVLFGEYIEASQDDVVTNDATKLRKHGCLALGPTGNEQGSIYAFDLKTGKVVTRRTFDRLPMPDRVLKIVNEWGKGTKVIKYGSKLEFLNRHQEKFNWENGELDDDGVLVQEEPIAHPGIPAEIPGVMLESDYK